MIPGLRFGGLLSLAALGLTVAAACGGASAQEGQMKQLQSAYSARPLKPHLPDHQFLQLDDGTLLFLHFDKPADKAKKLFYVGQAVPGKFTKAEAERVEKQFGKGFTHFHQKDCPGSNPDACHGGKGGEEGYWFRHVAVDSFAMPWGAVKPGIDHKFMPTLPPQ